MIGQGCEMAAFNIYEAKTSLSQLVERAAKGEEIVIAKAGKPMVKMVPVVDRVTTKKRDWGKNDLGITYIAPDFDAPMWTDEELEEFGF
jgi:prevent-host-death family protein